MDDLRNEVEACKRQLIEANAQAVREQVPHNVSTGCCKMCQITGVYSQYLCDDSLYSCQGYAGMLSV